MSNIPEKPQLNLEEVIEHINAELKNASSTPFSESAFLEFKEQITAYAVDLIAESVKRAKRHQAEGVSSSDVRYATQYLVSNTSHRIYRHAGTLAGLLLGAAVSNIVSIITTNQYGLNGVILTFVLTLVGTSLITIHVVKD
jgi:histone H3/H4